MTRRVFVATRYGRLLAVPHDLWIGEFLLHYGEYSQAELEVLLKFVTPESTVLDVGANIGALTIPLARHAKHVYAFEPQRLPFQMLCANLALNDIENVTAFPFIAADTEYRVVNIKPVDWSQPANSGGAVIETVLQGGDPAMAVMLDDLPLPKADLIKIDVEGMELSVLNGGGAGILGECPAISIEADRDQNTPDIIEFLHVRGYDVRWFVTPLFRADNYGGNKRCRAPDTVSINLLAAHPRRADHTATLQSLNLPVALKGDSFTKAKERHGKSA